MFIQRHRFNGLKVVWAQRNWETEVSQQSPVETWGKARRNQIYTHNESNMHSDRTTTYSTFGDRAFGAAGPGLWNSLPSHLKDTDISYSEFRRSLKTFLFGQWGHGAVWTVLIAPTRNILTYLPTYFTQSTHNIWCSFTPTLTAQRTLWNLWKSQDRGRSFTNQHINT